MAELDGLSKSFLGAIFVFNRVPAVLSEKWHRLWNPNNGDLPRAIGTPQWTQDKPSLSSKFHKLNVILDLDVITDGKRSFIPAGAYDDTVFPIIDFLLKHRFGQPPGAWNTKGFRQNTVISWAYDHLTTMDRHNLEGQLPADEGWGRSLNLKSTSPITIDSNAEDTPTSILGFHASDMFDVRQNSLSQSNSFYRFAGQDQGMQHEAGTSNVWIGPLYQHVLNPAQITTTMKLIALTLQAVQKGVGSYEDRQDILRFLNEHGVMIESSHPDLKLNTIPLDII